MEAHAHYLDKLEHKPNPKGAHENVVKIQFMDKRETTNVNRALVMAKVNAYVGVIQDKRKIAMGAQPISMIPIINPPKMSVADTPLPSRIQETTEPTSVPPVEPTVPPVAAEEELPPVPPVEPTVPPVAAEEELPPVPPVEPTVPPVAAAPKRRKLKVVDKAVAKEVDLSTALINGKPVGERLPKPEKIIVKAPTYYMSNRKIYTQKLNELFKEYNKQLLDEAATASCDPKTRNNETEMMIHQKVVRDYLNLYTPYRGLLLYFGLGAGKTAASISIAEGMKSHKKVFVLTPASLKMNYFSELKKYGDPLFRKNQFWEFVSTEGNPQYVDILSQVLSLPRQFVVQNKGAWLVDVSRATSNFKDLNAKDQHMLDEQLNHMIRTKYIDINYNGVSSDKLDELVAKHGANPFDHSVVVIDEAHNLVSRIINKRKKTAAVSSRLYQFLLSATDVRIVLLSGTPIINYPAEVGVMFNILRGYVTTWTFKIKLPAGMDSANILKILDEEDFRYYDYVDYTNGELTITRNPFGFGYVKKSGIERGQKLGHHKSPEAPEMGVATKVVPKTKKKLVIKDAAVPTQLGGEREHMSMFGEIAEPTSLRNGTKCNTPPTVFSPQSITKKVRIITRVQESIPTSFMRRNTRKRRTVIASASQPSTELPTELPTAAAAAATGDNEYYKVVDGLVQLKNPPKEDEDTPETELDKEAERDYLKYQNLEGEYGMIKGGADLVFNRYKGVHLDEQGNISNEDFVNGIKRVLRKHDIQVNDTVSTENFKALPDMIDDFNAQFVDREAIVMKDVNLFKKRVMGLTSYFRSAQESLLPQLIKTEKGETYHIVKCPMSNFQLETYEENRLAEIDLETSLRTSAKKRNKGKNDELEDKISSTYRIYSRVSCTFAFPSSLPRPMPFRVNEIETAIEAVKKQTNAQELGAESVLDNIVNETDEPPEVNDDAKATNISDEYAKKITETLNRLKTEKTVSVNLETGVSADVDVLSHEGLEIHSPKYLEILQNLKNAEHKGLHLIYSNFRTLEGVGIMKLIMEKNGMAEFRLKKVGADWEIEDTDPDLNKPRFALYTGTETAEEKEIIRNIYNSNWDLIPPKISQKLAEIHPNNYYGEIIKILMITSSGAEGINLENTRFVHIMEPYWHMTRLDQVVGRARRICSHKHLPEEMRTVKVFLYVAVFSEEQIKGKKHIELMKDVSRITNQPITTDEYLYESSQLKHNLNNQILRSIKETAIDCNLYSKLNKGENLVCYGNQYGKVASNDFSAYPTIQQDGQEKTDINIREEKAKISKITVGKYQYAYDKQTGELYDLDTYLNSGQLILFGHLRDDGKGGKIVIPVKRT